MARQCKHCVDKSKEDRKLCLYCKGTGYISISEAESQYNIQTAPSLQEAKIKDNIKQKNKQLDTEEKHREVMAQHTKNRNRKRRTILKMIDNEILNVGYSKNL